jgi:nicotinamidase-related amidase
MAFESALVVIDLQRDYFPGGKFVLPGIERVAAQAGALIDVFRTHGLPVIHVRHLERDPSVGFLLEGTPGSEIEPRVAPAGQDLLITKNWPNAFRDTTLARILHVLGPRDLVFCGAMTNMCIDATVRAAFDSGFHCTVIDDACAASDLEFNGVTIPSTYVQGAFMGALASAYGEVLDSKTFMARFAAA